MISYFLFDGEKKKSEKTHTKKYYPKATGYRRDDASTYGIYDLRVVHIVLFGENSYRWRISRKSYVAIL